MVSPRIRTVFFGSPEYAVPTLEGLLTSPLVEVVLVVTQPDRPRGRRGAPEATAVKRLAEAHGVPVHQPERLRRPDTELIAATAPDVGVVAASGHILPTHLLEAFPRDVLNVHASLLPRHRGASAVASAILAGDAESGATVMRVVREVDAGPVLGQARTPIGPLDTTATLTARIAEVGAALLVELLPRWVAGEIEAVPQDDALATFAPRLEKADGAIDWTRPALEIWRRVRAFEPWPLATTTYRGEPLVIHEAWPLEWAGEAPPGTVLAGDGRDLDATLPGRTARAVVATGAGALALLNVQRAGRRAVDIEAFLNGDPEFVGARLGG
ncbi:MAG: methionyl-tRNA formyltransferase [Dehalococcoidia bacterium]|nr:methionyl-tRNA formyltransferase [Dehalococcoidia bacterium]